MGTSPHYVESGHIVFARGENLIAVRFDPNALLVKSAPVRVLDGVRYDPAFHGSAFDVSTDGVLIYVPAEFELTRSELVWVDRSGAVSPLGVPPGPYYFPRLSPDGTRLAFVVSDDVWILDLSRKTMGRFTFSSAIFPTWSPDGTKVAFTIPGRDGSFNIFWKRSDGVGETTQLTKTENPTWPMAWFSEGDRLLFEEFHPDTERDIGILPVDKQDGQQMILSSRFSEHPAGLSPDATWMVYGSNETGRHEIYVRRTSAVGGKLQVSTAGGTQPVWSRDGTEIFYRDGARMFGVSVTSNNDELTLGEPKVLFEGDFAPGAYGFVNYDVGRGWRGFSHAPAARRRRRPNRRRVELVRRVETILSSRRLGQSSTCTASPLVRGTGGAGRSGLNGSRRAALKGNRTEHGFTPFYRELERWVTVELLLA